VLSQLLSLLSLGYKVTHLRNFSPSKKALINARISEFCPAASLGSCALDGYVPGIDTEKSAHIYFKFSLKQTTCHAHHTGLAFTPKCLQRLDLLAAFSALSHTFPHFRSHFEIMLEARCSPFWFCSLFPQQAGTRQHFDAFPQSLVPFSSKTNSHFARAQQTNKRRLGREWVGNNESIEINRNRNKNVYKYGRQKSKSQSQPNKASTTLAHIHTEMPISGCVSK